MKIKIYFNDKELRLFLAPNKKSPNWHPTKIFCKNLISSNFPNEAPIDNTNIQLGDCFLINTENIEACLLYRKSWLSSSSSYESNKIKPLYNAPFVPVEIQVCRQPEGRY